MLEVVGLVVAGLSLLLEVIGVAIPYWVLSNHVSGIIVYAGLWKQCISSDSMVNTCVDLTPSSVGEKKGIMASLQATRAMEIMAILAMSGVVACFVLKLFVMKQQNLLPKIGAAVAITGGTLAIIGCSIFALRFKAEGDIAQGMDLHAGFALCIVAAVGAYVSAVLSMTGLLSPNPQPSGVQFDRFA